MRPHNGLSLEQAANQYLQHWASPAEKRILLEKRMKELGCKHVPAKKLGQAHLDKVSEAAARNHEEFLAGLLYNGDVVPE